MNLRMFDLSLEKYHGYSDNNSIDYVKCFRSIAILIIIYLIILYITLIILILPNYDQDMCFCLLVPSFIS